MGLLLKNLDFSRVPIDPITIRRRWEPSPEKLGQRPNGSARSLTQDNGPVIQATPYL